LKIATAVTRIKKPRNVKMGMATRSLVIYRSIPMLEAQDHHARYPYPKLKTVTTAPITKPSEAANTLNIKFCFAENLFPDTTLIQTSAVTIVVADDGPASAYVAQCPESIVVPKGDQNLGAMTMQR